MEDAATAEIARLQLWQWAAHSAILDSGMTVTASYIDKLIKETAPTVSIAGVTEKHVKIASEYLSAQVNSKEASDFLTSDLMPYLDGAEGVQGQSKF